MTETQTEQIRQHLERGLPITPMGALNSYGCSRLAARIHELRQEGMAIDKTTIEDAVTGKRWAQYRVAS